MNTHVINEKIDILLETETQKLYICVKFSKKIERKWALLTRGHVATSAIEVSYLFISIFVKYNKYFYLLILKFFKN